MTKKLKRDQLPHNEAANWKLSFEAEKKLTFNLIAPELILQKSTYKTLAGENENRVRVYLGLEKDPVKGQYQICGFAVSTFMLGNGDVYADYETPVFKLTKENVNMSDNMEDVLASIRLYREWRAGKLQADAEGAAYREFIYPCGYLLTKFELHELFNVQNKDEIGITYGIAKTMQVIISGVKEGKSLRDPDPDEDYNNTGLCPPFCDDTSVFNS